MSQSTPNRPRPGFVGPAARFAVAGALLLGLTLSLAACAKSPTLLEEVPWAKYCSACANERPRGVSH